MVVRGAPAIGVAGAFGLALGFSKCCDGKSIDETSSNTTDPRFVSASTSFSALTPVLSDLNAFIELGGITYAKDDNTIDKNSLDIFGCINYAQTCTGSVTGTMEWSYQTANIHMVSPNATGSCITPGYLTYTASIRDIPAGINMTINLNMDGIEIEKYVDIIMPLH